jgi:hypothetical protein
VEWEGWRVGKVLLKHVGCRKKVGSGVCDK